MKHHDFRLLLI